MIVMKLQAQNFREHARTGRGGTRPVFRNSDGTGEIQALCFFRHPRFSARARKTAPGAGALPLPFWNFSGAWILEHGAFPL